MPPVEIPQAFGIPSFCAQYSWGYIGSLGFIPCNLNFPLFSKYSTLGFSLRRLTISFFILLLILTSIDLGEYLPSSSRSTPPTLFTSARTADLSPFSFILIITSKNSSVSSLFSHWSCDFLSSSFMCSACSLSARSISSNDLFVPIDWLAEGTSEVGTV